MANEEMLGFVVSEAVTALAVAGAPEYGIPLDIAEAVGIIHTGYELGYMAESAILAESISSTGGGSEGAPQSGAGGASTGQTDQNRR
jgi:hypothetical protein